jgi:hypothetical protein
MHGRGSDGLGSATRVVVFFIRLVVGRFGPTRTISMVIRVGICRIVLTLGLTNSIPIRKGSSRASGAERESCKDDCKGNDDRKGCQTRASLS